VAKNAGIFSMSEFIDLIYPFYIPKTVNTILNEARSMPSPINKTTEARFPEINSVHPTSVVLVNRFYSLFAYYLVSDPILAICVRAKSASFPVI
jgi:hypothetical protein